MTTKTVIDGKPLYKIVGREGQSLHGGSLIWSLPQGDAPGDWTSVQGELRMCENGLHLTDDPTRWLALNCRIFEVEAEDMLLGGDGKPVRGDDKVLARSVRLLRELNDDELEAFQIFKKGIHTVTAGVCLAYGSANVTAYGSANVTAYGSANVTASGSAKVSAEGSANVIAEGSANVTASGSANVTAYGSAKVSAYDSANVTASGSANVTASGSANVTASGSANVTAYGSAKVSASGSANVTAYGSANVTAYDSANVTAYDSAKVSASGESTIIVPRWYASGALVTVVGNAVLVDRRGSGKPTITVGE